MKSGKKFLFIFILFFICSCQNMPLKKYNNNGIIPDTQSDIQETDNNQNYSDNMNNEEKNSSEIDLGQVQNKTSENSISDISPTNANIPLDVIQKEFNNEYNRLRDHFENADKKEIFKLYVLAKEIVKNEPNNFHGHIALANVFWHMKEKEKLENELQIIETFNLETADDLMDSGSTYAIYGLKNKAEKQFKKAVEIEPLNPNTHYNYARILLLLKKVDESIAEYKKAIEIDKNFYKAYNNIGWALLLMNNYDEGIENIKKALEIKPDYPPSQLNLAFALMLKQDIDGSMVEFQKYIELKPDDPGGYKNIATLYQRKGDNKEAIKYMKIAVEKKPDDVVNLNNLSILLFSTGQYKESIEHLKKILEYKPKDENFVKEVTKTLSFACFKYGEVLETKNDNQEAIKAFEDYILYNPEAPEATKSEVRRRIEKLKEDIITY